MQFLAGAILLIAFGLAFWLALPRDGKVRSFLRTTRFKLTTRSRWSLPWAAASSTLVLA